MGLEEFADTSGFHCVTTWNGAPVPVEHGGPARLIIPKISSWKGAQWVNDITFLNRDILGFWEGRDCATTVDPRAGDRFS